jgi:plasmid stabilization system protein ParE
VKFTVVWTSAAEQDLAAIWMAASDPDAVSQASNTIDFLLVRDPESRGEPSFDTVRILTIPPLGVDFEVQEPDRIVLVLSVWRVE